MSASTVAQMLFFTFQSAPPAEPAKATVVVQQPDTPLAYVLRQELDALYQLDDDTAYARLPGLRRFDNGEGIFANGENRDVEMSEFIKVGVDILSTQGYDDPIDLAAQQVAAEAFLATLEAMSLAERQYTVEYILDGTVRTFLYEHEQSTLRRLLTDNAKTLPMLRLAGIDASFSLQVQNDSRAPCVAYNTIDLFPDGRYDAHIAMRYDDGRCRFIDLTDHDAHRLAYDSQCALGFPPAQSQLIPCPLGLELGFPMEVSNADRLNLMQFLERFFTNASLALHHQSNVMEVQMYR